MNAYIYPVTMEFQQKAMGKTNRSSYVQTIHMQPVRKSLDNRDGIINILNDILLKLPSWHFPLK